MNELDLAIQIALNPSSSGKQFIQSADCIRRIITPDGSYPGILADTNQNILGLIIQILTKFSSMVLQKVYLFQPHHISRAIESVNLSAIAYVLKYRSSHVENDLDDALNLILEGISLCQKISPNDLKHFLSAVFNLSAYSFKLKFYSFSLEIFNELLKTSDNSKIIGKSHKLRCQCLIALNKENTPEFKVSLLHSNDIENILLSWISIHPPNNPKILTNYLTDNIDISSFLPFYALHGDLGFLSQFPEYNDFFPNLKPPKIIYTSQQTIQTIFEKCFIFFNNSKFYECMIESVNLLKAFPTEKLKPNSMLALFFLYYWIVFSYDANGKPEAGIWYAKQMRKLFKSYPFASGFASFLELRCKIHADKLERLTNPQTIQFDAPFDWNAVPILYQAVKGISGGEVNSIYMIDSLFTSHCNNIIVQQEAFKYAITALKIYGCQYSLESYKYLCTTPETKALYLYLTALENVKNYDFNLSWSYSNPQKPNIEIIQMLDSAEELSRGFVAITRKIKQLKALIIGTNDQDMTAKLITSSLSISLDRFLKNPQQKFQLQFPILSVAYISIHEIEPCLLFASFHPGSKPFVVRIETGDLVDDFIDDLEDINERSTSISSSLQPKDWWTQKFALNEELKQKLKNFENNVLGKWKGLLAPYQYEPQQNPMISSLITYLQSFTSNSQKLSQDKKRLLAFEKNEIEKLLDVKQFKFDNYRKKGKKPLALILGKNVHQIPWENLPFVIKNNILITRVPSMKLVAIQSLKQNPVTVNTHSGFYILNPNGDLAVTEQKLQPIFNKMSWDRLERDKLQPQRMENLLQEKDLFIYCGHGSGNEYFNYSSLVEEQKSCKSSMLLMGCSSGKLNASGELDPTGVPYDCVAAGSGAVVANLWNVTDGDIDRFLLSLLDSTMKNRKSDLEIAVNKSRDSCKLRYLTGASPVIYGFPIMFNY